MYRLLIQLVHNFLALFYSVLRVLRCSWSLMHVYTSKGKLSINLHFYQAKPIKQLQLHVIITFRVIIGSIFSDYVVVS